MLAFVSSTSEYGTLRRSGLAVYAERQTQTGSERTFPSVDELFSAFLLTSNKIRLAWFSTTLKWSIACTIRAACRHTRRFHLKERAEINAEPRTNHACTEDKASPTTEAETTQRALLVAWCAAAPVGSACILVCLNSKLLAKDASSARSLRCLWRKRAAIIL